MALDAGDVTAVSGMSKAIYDQLDLLLSPPLQEMAPDDLEKVRDGWRKLAFAVAHGVIDHLRTNMEVFDIRTRGSIGAAVTGSTGAAAPGNHQHGVNLSGVQNNVVFIQSNDGTGHVR